MNKSFLAAAIVVALALPSLAWAEVPLMTPKQLQEESTHIIVGKVQKVYSFTHRDKDWENTDYVAEIAIDKIEKGDRLTTGGLAYVRYWHIKWLGADAPPPHASGHSSVAGGDSVRVFVAEDKKDHGLNVLLPNGFEVKAKNGK